MNNRIEQMAWDIVRREGGFVNDPADAGGATNYGVSLRYAIGIGLDLNGDHKTDIDDIRMVTPEQAKDLFIRDFFYGPKFYTLPEAVQPQMFDIAVNGGPPAAVMRLQEALCNLGQQVMIDGRLGTQTVTAAGQFDPVVLNTALVDAREAWYEDIVRRYPGQRRFLDGWIRRSEEFRG